MLVNRVHHVSDLDADLIQVAVTLDDLGGDDPTTATDDLHRAPDDVLLLKLGDRAKLLRGDQPDDVVEVDGAVLDGGSRRDISDQVSGAQALLAVRHRVALELSGVQDLGQGLPGLGAPVAQLGGGLVQNHHHLVAGEQRQEVVLVATELLVVDDDDGPLASQPSSEPLQRTA